MDSKAAHSDFSPVTLDLSAEKARDRSRTAGDGVCLIPYATAILFSTWHLLISLFLHKDSRALLQMIHWYALNPALHWEYEAYIDHQNWSLTKKNVLFGTVCLASFAGIASVNVHQLAYVTIKLSSAQL